MMETDQSCTCTPRAAHPALCSRPGSVRQRLSDCRAATVAVSQCIHSPPVVQSVCTQSSSGPVSVYTVLQWSSQCVHSPPVVQSLCTQSSSGSVSPSPPVVQSLCTYSPSVVSSSQCVHSSVSVYAVLQWFSQCVHSQFSQCVRSPPVVQSVCTYSPPVVQSVCT